MNYFGLSQLVTGGRDSVLYVYRYTTGVDISERKQQTGREREKRTEEEERDKDNEALCMHGA